RDGDEVVQVYLSNNPARVPTPLKQLVAFKRIHLKAGRAKALTFNLKRKQLAAYDSKGTPFVAPGDYTISVGGGQPDDPASGAVSATLNVSGD
ncbi:MAG: glucan 1,4-alpha-glucosidase, partial [Verrucomicrobia bacterium]|nr:glucan 1,4-alpha-glucosidase [Verrucomicrobiota bacterium]